MKIFLSLLILSHIQLRPGNVGNQNNLEHGVFLNPSTIVGAPYKYEIKYAADFAENSYIYFPRQTYCMELDYRQ